MFADGSTLASRRRGEGVSDDNVPEDEPVRVDFDGDRRVVRGRIASSCGGKARRGSMIVVPNEEIVRIADTSRPHHSARLIQARFSAVCVSYVEP
jgi:hypothetical protein